MEETLHTWPKEKRSFCRNSPASDSHLEKEVEKERLELKEGAVKQDKVKNGTLKQTKVKAV